MHCDYYVSFSACSPTFIVLIYELVRLFLETIMKSTVSELISVFRIIVFVPIVRSTLAFHNT